MHRNHPDLIQTDWETLGSKKEKLQSRKSPGIQNIEFYKIIQIVCALWLAIKLFYMSVCKHGFHTESSRGVLPAIYLAVTQFL